MKCSADLYLNLTLSYDETNTSGRLITIIEHAYFVYILRIT